jgi:hypothetical protein
MDKVIRRLIGVYHADGGLRGEMAYAIGKIRGSAHCGLCDITHRGLRPRRAWTAMVADLPVPVDLLHLNERDPDLREVTDGLTPCILAVTDPRLFILLDRRELDAVGGDVDRFSRLLARSIESLGLVWPNA